MKTFWLMILVCCWISVALADPTVAWTRTYLACDNAIDEQSTEIRCFIPTGDGDYVLGGSTYCPDNLWPPDPFRLALLKVNGIGERVWQDFGQYGNGYSPTNTITGVSRKANGGLVYTGVYWDEQSDYVKWMGEVTSSGFLVWDNYSTTDQGGLSIQTTADGGFVVAGFTKYSYSNRAVWKYDATGQTLQWSHISSTYDGVAWDIQQTSDGGYIVVGGGYYDRDNSLPGTAYIEKLTSSGERDWITTYGTGNDALKTVALTADGGYVAAGWLSGTIGPMYYHIVKVSSAGSNIWERTFDDWPGEVGTCVKPLSDGGYIVVGAGCGLFLTETRNGRIIKLNANGESEWDLPLTIPDVYGQGNGAWFDPPAVCIAADNKFLVSGTTFGDGRTAPQEGFLICVVDGPLAAPELVVNRYDMEDGMRLWWGAVPGAESYDVYSCDATGSTGSLTLLGNTTDLTWTDIGLSAKKFYCVYAKTGSVTSAQSNVAGYIEFVAGADGFTPFGLPFKFWVVPTAYHPTYGWESRRPSSIFCTQANPGGFLTADRIVRQDGGEFAWRNSALSGNWTGTLEFSATQMEPARAYWYKNNSGATRTLVLAGDADITGSGIPSATITPSTGGTAYSWRDPRELDPSQLGLIEQGFIGGTNVLDSDNIILQGGGTAWYNQSTGVWYPEDFTVKPGMAYWIRNRHSATWTYTYQPSSR